MLAEAPIIAALKAAGFVWVEGLLDYAALTAPPAAPIALYIVPEDESAGPASTTGVHDQRIVVRWRVVIIAASGLRGDATRESLRDASSRVRAALTGWMHPDACGPTDLVGGRLQAIETGAVAWAVRFATPTRYRKDVR